MSSKWAVQDITESGMYVVYCIDVFFNLALVFLVLLCNLYVVFVNGAGAQDVVTKVVILDFILFQQTAFKREIFMGSSGRLVLQAIKQAFEVVVEDTPSSSWVSCCFGRHAGLKNRNAIFRTIFAGSLLALAQLPIFLSLAFIVYAPLCKPGVDTIASLDIKTS